jgi:hypothetical protein
MEDTNDRRLMVRELTRLTAAGWQIVSRADGEFQVMYPHHISSVGMVLLVIAPLGLGAFVSLFSVATATVLFWLALLCAILLVLDHLSSRPKLLYITADQLRSPATIERTATGLSICSVCQSPTRADAVSCRVCGAHFIKA